MSRSRPFFRTTLLALTLCVIPDSAAAAPTRAFAPGELLIGFRDDIETSKQQRTLARAGAKVIKHLATSEEALRREGGVHRVAIRGDLNAALEKLQEDPSVAFVEPNYLSLTTLSISMAAYGVPTETTFPCVASTEQPPSLGVMLKRLGRTDSPAVEMLWLELSMKEFRPLIPI